MGLEQDLGIDLGAVDMNAANAAVASNGLVPEGLHHAALAAVKSGEANSGTPFREFTFVILAGPAAGQQLEHTLYLPNAAQAEDKKKKSINQLAIYAHRLGLKKQVAGADGKTMVLVAIEGKHDFSDCRGAACVIDVRHEEEVFKYQRGPKAGQEGKITKAKLTFEGVLAVDDKRCEKVPKGKVPADLLAGGAAVPAGGKGDAFADI